MNDPAARLADNLAAIRQRIDEATARSGRPPGSVQMVAVTKYVGDDLVELLVQQGCRELGESRPQELWRKAKVLAERAEAATHDIHWHMIGHLQTNKVRRTLPLVQMVQAVDSLRLARAIDSEAERLGISPRVLLEVNISEDAGKHGFAPGELTAADRSSEAPDAREPLQEINRLRHLHVVGLMGMSSLAGGPSEARRNFADLRRLRDRLAAACPPGTQLGELSMGMSGDYEVAIEEGATIVRIGSALFSGLLGN